MVIGIANDHRGYKLKIKIKEYLCKKGYKVEDLGSLSTESVDYPDYAFKLGTEIVEKRVDFGIAICGSGIGISIACNKVKGIRCAKVNNAKETKLAIIDNDANVIALSGSTPFFRALDILDVVLKVKHPQSERHDRRIRKITDYEEGKYEC
ncbi:MAG: RpiB/LacA/LacB family sugar-phosphate isomerase [Firmicutes bacterium]|nr:RpiB/LacA/LacB family sugar-phosphate isomerase [Bacillota bacterium]